MTGLEAALAKGSATLLGACGKAASKLGRRITFRYRVYRRVRKVAGYNLPRKGYTRWLKSLTQDDLVQLPEDSHATLANRLDSELCAARGNWLGSSDHLSRSLLVLEFTFPAVAACLDGADQVALTQHWEQKRGALVRDRLLDLAGPEAALSATDLAQALLQRSGARRDVRLQPFGVTAAAVSDAFAAIAAPTLKDRQVLVVTGEFGSGKSEVAERWHLGCIDALSTNADAPVPVWVPARDLAHANLETTITEQFGSSWARGRGARIVIDGLDEVGPSAAQNALDQARILVRSRTNCQILATARPGAIAATDDETRPVALLSVEAAEALASIIAGTAAQTWGLTPEMKETLRRPFFALAYGTIVGAGGRVSAEVDLIRKLVEISLSRPGERDALGSSETYSALRTLAVNLTDSERDGLNPQQREAVRRSRLLANNEQGKVRFALPILEQWFAAQALLEDPDLARKVTASAANFGKWRWAAAVALADADNDEVADRLVETWIADNPGATAWLLKQAFGHLSRLDRGDDSDLDPKTSGLRLLRAYRAWADSLGPVAADLLGARIASRPVRLGVTVRGRHLDCAIDGAEPESDCVVPAPTGRLDGTWVRHMSGEAPRSPAWPWTYVMKEVSDSVSGTLSRYPFIGYDDTIAAREWRYDLARKLTTNRGSLFRDPIDAEEVHHSLTENLGRIADPENARFTFRNSIDYRGQELTAFRSWIEATGATEIVSPTPAPDAARPKSGWIWDFYTSEGLANFEVEAFGLGCEAYDDAAARYFSRFAWAMASAVKSPFGVALDIDFDVPPDSHGGPGIWMIRAPMAILKDVAQITAESRWSSNGRAVITPRTREQASERDFWAFADAHYTRWLAGRDAAFESSVNLSAFGSSNVGDARPASAVAADWLWSDLTALGLGTGRRPEIR